MERSLVQRPGHDAGRPVAVGLVAITALGMALAVGWLAPSPARGHDEAEPDRIVLDRPLNLAFRRADNAAVSGRMIAYSPSGFELTDREGGKHLVAWSELPAARVLAIHETLLRDREARAWVNLGVMLRTLEDGEPLAERVFTRAERMDPALADMVGRARRGEPLELPDEQPSEDPQELAAPGVALGPQIRGNLQAVNWGTLSDARIAQAVQELKNFAERTREQIQPNLRLIETDFFLFYNDLPSDEAAFWASLLDRMYRRLGELFGLERGQNIWLGKGLILVFHNEQDYHRFQQQMHNTDSTGTLGMCHGFGNGHVHVAFYRQPNRWMFAHILVHESVHGFLHRYRSPQPIPSWINEGLAEVIASELVPESRATRNAETHARRILQDRRSTGGMFHLPHIEAWHYGVASGLTAFMIRENRRGYVDFVNAIKDGMPWQQALEEKYGVTLQRLVAVYGETLRIRDLQP